MHVDASAAAQVCVDTLVHADLQFLAYYSSVQQLLIACMFDMFVV